MIKTLEVNGIKWNWFLDSNGKVVANNDKTNKTFRNIEFETFIKEIELENDSENLTL